MLKTKWVGSYGLEKFAHVVDGARFATDTENVLNQLESEGYDIVSITPVISGRYNWQKYDSGGSAATGARSSATCASWGYSMTDGVMITAQKR